LSLIDKLSPKGLTDGREIAVTGTMRVDGSVGPIGGIRQKVAAVRDAGVRYFLVPIDNAVDACAATGDPYAAKTLAAAAEHAANPDGKTAVDLPACGDAKSGVRVIPVTDLNDALDELRALHRHGKN
ncbi:MAG TPA: S16 family serine protease, partial [Acidimicrobiales bacterium]|nr:S16 family serine protease [Acidimicrobiales bacterium]